MGEMADWILDQCWDDCFRDYDDPLSTWDVDLDPTKRPEPYHVLLVQEWKAETHKAWLILTMAGNEHWLPKSQCTQSRFDRLTISDWIRRERKMDIGAENTPPPPDPCDLEMDDIPWPTGPEDYYT